MPTGDSTSEMTPRLVSPTSTTPTGAPSTLPHDWSIEGPAAAHRGRRQQRLLHPRHRLVSQIFPSPAAGKKVVVEFDGVYMNSDVWINGNFLGRRPYGFVGFRYDITQYLKTNGTPNILAVQRQRLRRTLHPLVYRRGHLPPCAADHHRLHRLPPRWRHYRHHARGHSRTSHRPGQIHHRRQLFRPAWPWRRRRRTGAADRGRRHLRSRCWIPTVPSSPVSIPPSRSMPSIPARRPRKASTSRGPPVVRRLSGTLPPPQHAAAQQRPAG